MSTIIQQDLFDTREWRPEPEKRTNRHLELLALVQRMVARPAGCFASIGWFSRKFGVCIRTIKAWIRKLKDLKLIEVKLRGPKSAIFLALAAAAPLFAPLRAGSSYIKSSTHKQNACVKKQPRQEETPEFMACEARLREQILAIKASGRGWAAWMGYQLERMKEKYGWC